MGKKRNANPAPVVAVLTPEQEMEALRTQREELNVILKASHSAWNAAQAQKKEVQGKISALNIAMRTASREEKVSKTESRIVELQNKLNALNGVV